MPALLDEASTPRLRTVFGGLLATSRRADIAVAHVRLAALDLSERETAAVSCCRILIGRLDAASLVRPVFAGVAAARMDALAAFVASGRVEIRSAGMGAWYPDFSIYRGVRGGSVASDIALLGAHYFHEPVAALGPSLTCALTEAGAIGLLLRRFESLWEHSHDVREPVLHAIRGYARGEDVAVRAAWL